eukprot:scaffold318_cov396-Prasinococcus_capsulatus_cf.AAC.3
MSAKLRENLVNFRTAPTLISAEVQALASIVKQKEERADEAIAQLAQSLIRASVAVLSAATSAKPSLAAERNLVPALFTIGESVQLNRDVELPERAVTLVQALLTSHESNDPAELDAQQRALTQRLQTTTSQHAVCAHAWLTLGKLCLHSEKLAKNCIPLFIQEVSLNKIAAVRNNIVVALADLCIRYTGLVDPHIEKLALCLGDACEVVRRQTLLLLVNLIQRDYVKWRGTLFHRILRCLVDDSSAIRKLAGFLVGELLKAKGPLLAYNHFVELLFFFNGINDHGAAGTASQGRFVRLCTLNGMEFLSSRVHRPHAGVTINLKNVEERQLFELTGEDNRRKRETIYATLLRYMSPEHKFAVTGKLCTEVLACVADTSLGLEASKDVLHDALTVLASRDIKIRRNADAEEEEEAAVVAAAAAKGKLVNSMMKKNLVENLVPILIELKELLRLKQSSMQSHFMLCMCAMLKDYKVRRQPSAILASVFACCMWYLLFTATNTELIQQMRLCCVE